VNTDALKRDQAGRDELSQVISGLETIAHSMGTFKIDDQKFCTESMAEQVKHVVDDVNLRTTNNEYNKAVDDLMENLGDMYDRVLTGMDPELRERVDKAFKEVLNDCKREVDEKEE